LDVSYPSLKERVSLANSDEKVKLFYTRDFKDNGRLVLYVIKNINNDESKINIPIDQAVIM